MIHNTEMDGIMKDAIKIFLVVSAFYFKKMPTIRAFIFLLKLF